jgi:hypothetical protein
VRRRDLSHEELAKVIRLRQENASWLKIQRETGIPRRIAQRAYEQYQRSQAREELKAARKEVAAEEFRMHLNLLTRLADNIVLTICIPSSPNETRHAKEVLDMLLQGDWLHEVDFIPAVDPTERGKRQMGRQSQMLFESLQVHTHAKVRWQALDEWEEAWDTCISDLVKFREEAQKILSNILNQKPKLIEKIVEVSRKKDAMERMIDGVLHMAWQQLLEPDQDFPVMQPMPLGNGRTDLTFGKNHLTEGLIFTEADLAEEVAKACKWAAENLYKGNTTLAIGKQINIMQERIKELEEMLDLLRLRSLILSTQCNLCPA